MKSKNILVVIFIVIIIMIITLGLKIYQVNKSNSNNLESENSKSVETIKLDFGDKNMIKTYNEFFSIYNAFTKYINYNFNENKTALFSVLDKEYIEKNNITEDNVIDKIGSIGKSEIFIKEMYYKKQNEYNKVYLVKAYVYDYNEKEYDYAYSGKIERDYKKVAAYVLTDEYDMTFSIIPTNYE